MPPDDVRTCIVTDTRMYRDGLAEVLAPRAGVAVVGTAADVRGCLDLLTRAAVDVVLLDVAVEGVEAITEVAAAGALVIALGIDEVEHDVLTCIEAGAACYVSRDASLDSLAEAILASARGEGGCPPAVTGRPRRRAPPP